MKFKKLKLIIRIVIITVIFTALILFFIWAKFLSGFVVMNEAQKAMKNEKIHVTETSSYYMFFPKDGSAAAGVILYPGARVDSRAYAPLAASIAENGYAAAIVKMPLNLSMLAPRRAADVIKDFPMIKVWGAGGHSLGGVLAAEFAAGRRDVAGVVFLASYSTEKIDLRDKKIVSIYGTRDGIASEEKILNPLLRYPSDVFFVRIEGANHAQFGWYGNQKGDNPAEIDRALQNEIVSENISSLLQAIQKK